MVDNKPTEVVSCDQPAFSSTALSIGNYKRLLEKGSGTLPIGQL